jgi:hypothetical protein
VHTVPPFRAEHIGSLLRPPALLDLRPQFACGALAYSTNGSGTHIIALRFMKDYGFQAKLVATGNVPATSRR